MIERFNDAVKIHDTPRIQSLYESLKRSNDNLKVIEDCFVIGKILEGNHKQKIEKIIKEND